MLPLKLVKGTGFSDCICVYPWDKHFQHSAQTSGVYIHDKILQSQVSAKHQTLRDRGHIKEVNKEPDTLEIHLHWVENVRQQKGIKLPWRHQTPKWWTNNLQTAVKSSSLSKFFLSCEGVGRTAWSLRNETVAAGSLRDECWASWHSSFWYHLTS